MSTPNEAAQTVEYGIEYHNDLFNDTNMYGNAFFALAAISVARAGVLIDPSLNIRNYLPEPLDIPDHVGNVAGMGLVVFPFLHGYLKESQFAATEKTLHEGLKKRFAIVTGALVVGANAFGEFVGYGSISTPDPIDFVYGLIGGFIFYRAHDQHFLPEEDIDNEIRLYEEAIAANIDKPEDRSMLQRLTGFKNSIKDFKQKIRDDDAKAKTKKPQKLAQPTADTTKKTVRPSSRYTPPKPKK